MRPLKFFVSTAPLARGQGAAGSEPRAACELARMQSSVPPELDPAAGLLAHARNVFSQNGEDGIIAAILSVIGWTDRVCCEFGAWDGVHLANTRSLLLNGWRGVLIESDPSRFASLQETYRADPRVVCVQALVDDGQNSVGSILRSASVREELDFLSIDIDGEDFYAFSGLDVRPRLICVEVNAGHSPAEGALVPRNTAAHNIGQPLQCFVEAGQHIGYRLVCYSGNAFFLRNDVGCVAEIPTLSAEAAYQQFLARVDKRTRRWLYMVNKGWVNPWFKFHNPYLTASRLALSTGELFGTPLTGMKELAKKQARSWLRHATAKRTRQQAWPGIPTQFRP